VLGFTAMLFRAAGRGLIVTPNVALAPE